MAEQNHFKGTETSPPQKVMILVHEGLYGGGSRQTYHIIETLLEEGFHVVVVSNAKDSWFGKQLSKLGERVQAYFTPWIQRAIHPLREIQVLGYLLSVTWKEKPDILMASGVKLIGFCGLVGWLCRVPKRFAIIRGQGAAPGSLLLKIIFKMERFLALLGTQFITVCEHDRQVMISEGIALPEQITTIQNGTDVHFFQELTSGQLQQRFQLDSGAEQQPFYIGMVGRLCGQKRYQEFITFMEELCAQYPHVMGLLVGEGEHRDALQAQIDDTDFPHRIQITGFCENMKDVYGDLDLSVLFTHYEGLPNALLESAAAGVPVIAENVCGNGEIVRHQENGYLIAPGDIEAAVKYAGHLIKHTERLKQMGAAGQEIVALEFDRKQQLQKLVRVLKGLAPQEQFGDSGESVEPL